LSRAVSKYKLPFAKRRFEAYHFSHLSAEFKYMPFATGIQPCQLQQFTYPKHFHTHPVLPTAMSDFNPLTPNDHYTGRTAPLTSKRFILYIYSTNIGTEYFKHGIYSPCFSLFKMQNKTKRKTKNEMAG
jgi:hypothetical protein